MAQEREIATRIASLDELLDIVSAIRAIAASQMQQALRSLEAIRRYSEMVREALSDAATLLPSDGTVAPTSELSKSGLIVFCAEHGLCGGFNEHPLHVAERALADRAAGFVLIVVGSRGGQICRERGLKPDLVLPMATHCAGVTGAARRVATEVYRMFSDGRIAGLEVVYAQHAGSQFSPIERHRLLPLEMPVVERRPLAMPPLINLSPRRLFDDIVGEYFFAALGERRDAIVLQRELDSLPHDGSRASKHWKQVRGAYKTCATRPARGRDDGNSRSDRRCRSPLICVKINAVEMSKLRFPHRVPFLGVVAAVVPGTHGCLADRRASRPSKRILDIEPRTTMSAIMAQSATASLRTPRLCRPPSTPRRATEAGWWFCLQEPTSAAQFISEVTSRYG